MKNKVLGVCRVSTDRQEIESQINELREFIIKEGYTDDDIIWVVGDGCSAIKEDDKFRYNIKMIHDHIQSGHIEKMYCFALDRVARRKVTMDLLIEDLAEHKVNMIVKEPARMELLNPDGSRNDGMELAITLFVQLSQSEMMNKKSRFARARKRNASDGRYNGGKTIKFGYKVNEGGYFVIDDDAAEIVRLAFQLYLNGYTLSKLETEMKARGYEFCTVSWLHRVLSDKAYIGQGRQKYERIISDELFNAVQDLKKENTVGKRERQHFYFGSKLIKCKECGRSHIASHDQYRCKCDSEAISIANMDGLLWWVAYDKECNWRMKNDKDNKANIRKEMAVLQRKIDAADSGKAKVEIKRQRALNAYLDAAIDEDQYNDRIAKVNEELKSINFNIAQWKDAMSKMEAVLNSVDGVDIKKKYEAVMNNVESADEREMQSIVRKWIIRVDMDLPYVKLTTSDGKEYTAKYHLRMKKMIWSTMGGGYLPIYPIYRNDEGLQIANPRNNNSNMMKAIDRNERQLGIVEIVNNIGKFWKNSIL